MVKQAEDRKPLTALILDDDQVSRMVIGKVLERLGFAQRLEAIRGAEASRTLDGCTPDLVFVDGLLPDTTGLRWIEKERGRLPKHVIFASAFWKDVRSRTQLTQGLGVSAVLRKPFVVGELVREVGTLIGRIAAPCEEGL